LDPVVYYEGERIYFRPLETEDEPLLRRWINDPRTWSTLGHRSPVNEHREREWIENAGKDERNIVVGIVARDGDHLIGSAGLHGINLVNHSAWFGLMIGAVDARDRGYGTEATRLIARYGFEELNLHRIELSVFAHNPRAIRAYEKAGYVREGIRRQAFYRGGRYRDVYLYAILRSEYGRQATAEGARPEPAGV
jgi:RimJ/RimL family protein N-acetyltransferase